jgi:preprotein translocase SecE subunit
MAEQIQHEEPGVIGTVRDFLVDTRIEMDKVSWPGKVELTASTRAVILGSLLLGVAIGLVDKLLQLVLVDGVALLSR